MGSGVAGGAAGLRAQESSDAVDLRTLEEVAKKMEAIYIESPSKSFGKSNFLLLRAALADMSFITPPIVAASQLSQSAFARVDTDPSAKFSERCDKLVQECYLYEVSTAFTPPWTTTVQRSPNASMNAAAVFGPPTDVLVPETRVKLPWQCQPEVFVTTTQLQHSAFFAELKSVNALIFNQVMTYGALALTKSFFTKAEGGSSVASLRRFYPKPLVGYGLVAFAHCGYLVALEWVGKLFMTPVRARQPTIPNLNPNRCPEFEPAVWWPGLVSRVLVDFPVFGSGFRALLHSKLRPAT